MTRATLGLKCTRLRGREHSIQEARPGLEKAGKRKQSELFLRLIISHPVRVGLAFLMGIYDRNYDSTEEVPGTMSAREEMGVKRRDK